MKTLQFIIILLLLGAITVLLALLVARFSPKQPVLEYENTDGATIIHSERASR